ncbi:MAG TPA: hypothetical protein VK395_07995 [Gemmataceae bacterium]|nr:hypothetical protein [Gemmataceae bacterium]
MLHQLFVPRVFVVLLQSFPHAALLLSVEDCGQWSKLAKAGGDGNAAAGFGGLVHA